MSDSGKLCIEGKDCKCNDKKDILKVVVDFWSTKFTEFCEKDLSEDEKNALRKRLRFINTCDIDKFLDWVEHFIRALPPSGISLHDALDMWRATAVLDDDLRKYINELLKDTEAMAKIKTIYELTCYFIPKLFDKSIFETCRNRLEKPLRVHNMEASKIVHQFQRNSRNVIFIMSAFNINLSLCDESTVNIHAACIGWLLGQIYWNGKELLNLLGFSVFMPPTLGNSETDNEKECAANEDKKKNTSKKISEPFVESKNPKRNNHVVTRDTDTKALLHSNNKRKCNIDTKKNTSEDTKGSLDVSDRQKRLRSDCSRNNTVVRNASGVVSHESNQNLEKVMISSSNADSDNSAYEGGESES